MRLKKGFTLAEILIVLVVIGILAALTVPSLSKGVTEAQYKAAYKKAFNTIANITAMEKASGQLYTVGNADNANELFDTIVKSVSVKAFVEEDGGSGPNNSTGKILNKQSAFRTRTDYKSEVPTGNTRFRNWIITDDNVAYLILPPPENVTCGTKLEIGHAQANSHDTLADLTQNSCFTIWVDVNGVEAGPNTAIGGGAQGLDNDATMPALVEDQYPIYIGNDGATPGNNVNTITGRIVADLK